MLENKNNTTFIKPRRSVLMLIRLYQKTLSPDHGLLSYKNPHGYCKHYPSCSEYAYQAVEAYGVVKGGVKATKRVLKCNPFSQGGYDPIKLTK
jgi:uncharacterized protein